MRGVPGPRGPVPKRSDQRHGHRAKGAAEGLTTGTGTARPAVSPDPDPDWHPAALRWYVAFRTSGQVDYFQDTDWATAYVWAGVLSEQLFGGAKASAVKLQAWSSANAELLGTEGARRRLRVELERQPRDLVDDDVEDELDRHRARRAAAPRGGG